MANVLLEFFKTDTGISIIVLALGVLIAYAKKKFLPAIASDEWTKWEGYIISGIKAAEKAIPDDTPDKALKRADEALKLVISAYEKSQGKKPSEELVAQIKNAIPVVHDQLEAAGTL